MMDLKEPNQFASGQAPKVSRPETEYERFLRMQIEQFEDDVTEGRCYPEMPEGQFVRSK